MAKYKKCPRCELNYILENVEYCEICQQELRGAKVVESFDYDDDDVDLCPICHKNYLNDNETMCEACARQAELNQSKSLAADIDTEDFNTDTDDEPDETAEDEFTLSLEEIQDGEFKEEFEDEEQEEESSDGYTSSEDYDPADLEALDEADEEEEDEEEESEEDEEDF